jgi:hypothetical protein
MCYQNSPDILLEQEQSLKYWPWTVVAAALCTPESQRTLTLRDANLPFLAATPQS